MESRLIVSGGEAWKYDGVYSIVDIVVPGGMSHANRPCGEQDGEVCILRWRKEGMRINGGSLERKKQEGKKSVNEDGSNEQGKEVEEEESSVSEGDKEKQQKKVKTVEVEWR
ncbi:hypothetical protein Pcinc_004392 [Petrolisthes cinctipes]|uniref:Uncharacterized protein n=1 Tax=Petrolisthes cinctipes TaxID=88211 RepID=A0AAE1L063_PETCI|nr:hypothetical protein Pcinc_004392 [Petrolisthes cinctipes]